MLFRSHERLSVDRSRDLVAGGIACIRDDARVDVLVVLQREEKVAAEA